MQRERETTCSGMITHPSAARLEHGSQSSQQRAWVPNTQSPTDLPQGKGLCHQAQGPWPPSRSQWPSHANSLTHTTPQKNGSVHYSVSQCQMSLQPQLQAVRPGHHTMVPPRCSSDHLGRFLSIGLTGHNPTAPSELI